MSHCKLVVGASRVLAQSENITETRKKERKRKTKERGGGGSLCSERERASGAAAGSGEVAVSGRAAPPVPQLVVFAAVRPESHHGEAEGGPVLLDVPELRSLPVQGGRAAVRRVQARHRPEKKQHRLRADSRAVCRPLESLGDGRDGDRDSR